MPFEILRNDIVNMQTDAIVNTANPRAVVGSGVDSAIHAAAGPELLAARQAAGPLRPGQSIITPGFRLDAKYVIHTVGPVWRGGWFGEEKILRSCYDSALRLAADHGCRSVAFPLISAGNYGFPREPAFQIALSAFRDFLKDHEMRICLVVFEDESFSLSKKLVQNVSVYIDRHYVEQKLREEYTQYREAPQRLRRDYDMEECAARPMAAPSRTSLPDARPHKPLFSQKSLKQLLRETDAGFTDTLLKLIDRSGKKDSEIYKRAGLSKQHFSKIRNNPDYKPTKPTAIALALALELDLDQTRDLIGRAGYALTTSSKFDVIIMYFIEQRNYNIVQINLTLYEFDQSLLY